MSWNDIKNKQSEGSTSSTNTYVKLHNGANKGRVLDEQPESRWVHWIPQANSGKGQSVNCIGKGCPVCAEMAAAKKAKQKSKYSCRKQHVINWLNRETNQVEILDKGNKVFDGLLSNLEMYGDLRNMDVNIVQTGTDFNDISYNVLPVFPPTPLTAEEAALPKHDLKAAIAPLTKEEVLTLMAGGSLGNNDAVANGNATAPTANPMPGASTQPANIPVGVDFTQPR